MVKKEKYSMTVEEGWFAEEELRDELGWSATKIAGAIKHCMANKETHVRCACRVI